MGNNHSGLRVLLVTDFYPPFIGGTERQVQLLGKELVLRGHEVIVATVWHVGLSEQEHDSGITVHRLKGLSTQVSWFSKDPGRRFHPPFPEPSIVRGLHKLIAKWQPEVVHAFGWIAYSCAVAVSRQKVPLLISAQDYGYSCALRTLLRHGQICSGPAVMKCLTCAIHTYGFPKALAAVIGISNGKKLLTKEVGIFHSLSTFVQSVIRRDLLDNQSPLLRLEIVTIPPIVVPSSHELIADDYLQREYLDRLPAEPFILFVGALQAHKGLNTLLAAYKQLVSSPPLVLIGTAWPETPLEFPSKVIVLRDVPSPAVMIAWERSLFGVAPSVWAEPFGGVVVEAMSKGKAIIGSAVGGHSDIIVDGETGFLVPPGDADALVQAMTQLIDNESLRERFGRAGLERMNLFTVESIIPRFESLYQKLANDAKGNRS